MPVVIVELGYVVALFAALCAYLVARGLLTAWGHSIGYLLQWLAGVLDFDIRIPHLHTFKVRIGHFFASADNAVHDSLTLWATGAEIEMAYALHGLEKLWDAMARAVQALAHETAATFDWLLKVRLRQLVKLLGAAAILPLIMPKIVRWIAGHLPHTITKVTRTVVHSVPSPVVKVLRIAATAPVAIPRWVLHLPQEISGLTKRNVRLAARLRRVEGVFGAAVFAGLLANALGIATRCVRRGNIGRAARSICGMDGNLLSELLIGSTAIVGAVSIVEFAEGMRAIEDEAVTVAGKLIREWPS